jgi:hypothetical protein
MRKLAFAIALLLFLPSLAGAGVTEQDFTLDTTEDLIDLCSVDPQDPHAVAAIHMCHGYVTGLVHFHIVVGRVFEGNVYCMDEEERPTRDQAVAMLVEWSRANPQHDSLEAVDGVLQWAHETYPCSE